MEILGAAVLDGLDHLVRELVTLGVDDAGLGFPGVDGLSDRQEQMGFPQTGISVDKQRIVGFSRIVGHRQRGGMGKFVGVSHNEAVKSVALHLRQGIVIILGIFAAQVQVFLLFLCARQDQQIEIFRKQIAESRFDDLAEALVNYAALEGTVRIEDQATVLQLYRLTVTEPGVHGDGGQLPGKVLFQLLPDVIQRIHMRHLNDQKMFG